MQNEPNQNPNQAKVSGVNFVARRNARHYALQAMYQWSMTGNAAIDIEKEFLAHHIDKQFDLDYFKELLHGTITMQVEIDKTFQPYLGRLHGEIDPIELAVLRVSTYELLKRPDVPYRVVINEALELTKKFGSVEGFKFVNGVLDRVAKKVRETEINMGKQE